MLHVQGQRFLVISSLDSQMRVMTPRERVLNALNHREPDRLPIDIGGSFATGINVAAYEALKEHLGIRTETVVASRRSQIAEVEEEVRQRLGIDTYPLLPRAPEGAEVVYPDGSYRDEWGVVRRKPEGGHYYVVEAPLAGEISLADLETFPWPDPDDPSYVRGLAEEAREPITPSSSACWWASFINPNSCGATRSG